MSDFILRPASFFQSGVEVGAFSYPSNPAPGTAIMGDPIEYHAIGIDGEATYTELEPGRYLFADLDDRTRWIAGIVQPPFLTDEEQRAALDALELSQTEHFDNTGLFGYAENKTAVATVAGASSTPVPGCVVSVPPTDRPVLVMWGCMWQTTTGGQGYLYTQTWEISLGGAVDGESLVERCQASELAAVTRATPRGVKYAPPSKEWRSYMLTIVCVQEGGSSLAGKALNLAAENGKSFIMAGAA